jgi:HK97 family phage major capsid protein
VQAVPTPANPAYEHAPEIKAKAEELTTKLDAAVKALGEAKDTDTARYNEQREAIKAITSELDTLKEAEGKREREAEVAKAISDATEAKQAVEHLLKAKAHANIGGNTIAQAAHQKGSFLAGVLLSRSSDHDEQTAGKAMLRELGVSKEKAWGEGGYIGDAKATLGSTDATGQYIVPNNLVDEFIRPAMFTSAVSQITTSINGVTSNGVDIPFRHYDQVTSRATVAAFGDTKENVDLAYLGYTATMYTLARIYDIGKQFARQSQGAAEQDVMQELADGFARGVDYYALLGTGSSQPYGLLTALDNAGSAYDTTFTAATTLAGSVASAIATAAGYLGGREADGNISALMNSSGYWTMLRQGADEAGFYFNPAQGPTAINVPAGTLVSPFGIPVYKSNNLTADHMIVGDFSKLKIYYGESFRVDSSDVAGSRWDKNLIGFRGEQEMGLDARPVVYAGHFQLVEDLVP